MRIVTNDQKNGIQTLEVMRAVAVTTTATSRTVRVVPAVVIKTLIIIFIVMKTVTIL